MLLHAEQIYTFNNNNNKTTIYKAQ